MGMALEMGMVSEGAPDYARDLSGFVPTGEHHEAGGIDQTMADLIGECQQTISPAEAEELHFMSSGKTSGTTDTQVSSFLPR